MRCYCSNVRQVARRLTRFYESELREAGMNPAQFELLATVQGRSGSSQRELAAVMDVDQTTLSRNLKLLIGQGWVLGTASRDDRRQVEYALTAEGKLALAAAMPCWERAKTQMDIRLGASMPNVWTVLEALSVAAEME